MFELMRTRIGWGASISLVGLSLVAGCSDGLPESTVAGGGASSTGSTSSTAGNASNAGSLNLGSMSSTGGSEQGAAGTGGTSSSGGAEGCAAANEQAELSPVYLVFLLDESGSMGDGTNGDRTKKWDPVVAALKAFFAD